MQNFSNLLSSPVFHAACLAAVMAAAMLAVLSRIYDDTLSQRAALMTVALGAAAQLSLIVKTGYTSPGYGLMLLGLALYAASTVVKVWQRWYRAGKPDHPTRRSTDRMDLDDAWRPTLPQRRMGERRGRAE